MQVFYDKHLRLDVNIMSSFKVLNILRSMTTQWNNLLPVKATETTQSKGNIAIDLSLWDV